MCVRVPLHPCLRHTIWDVPPPGITVENHFFGCSPSKHVVICSNPLVVTGILGSGAPEHIIMRVIPTPLQWNLSSWSRLGSADFDKLKGRWWELRWRFQVINNWNALISKNLWNLKHRFPLFFVDPLSSTLCTSSGTIQNAIMFTVYHIPSTVRNIHHGFEHVEYM